MLECGRCCPRVQQGMLKAEAVSQLLRAASNKQSRGVNRKYVFLPRYWQVFFVGLDAVPVSVRARSQLIFSHMKCLGDTCERSTHQRATRPICRRTSLAADSPHWDVSTYSSSHSSRRFLSGCCSGSWVGCILSHAVRTKSCEECEVPDWVIGSACDEFYRNQNRFISRLLSVKHKTEVQERKVPDWAVNCGPNLLEGIWSELSFSDGQQFVHFQPVYLVHGCMLQHDTACILYIYILYCIYIYVYIYVPYI